VARAWAVSFAEGASSPAPVRYLYARPAAPLLRRSFDETVAPPPVPSAGGARAEPEEQEGDEVARRAAHLRGMRDRLLEQRRQQREQTLRTHEASATAGATLPCSPREPVAASSSGSGSAAATGSSEAAKVAARRALVERLRAAAVLPA
jgi:hypothetical protein